MHLPKSTRAADSGGGDLKIRHAFQAQLGFKEGILNVRSTNGKLLSCLNKQTEINLPPRLLNYVPSLFLKLVRLVNYNVTRLFPIRVRDWCPAKRIPEMTKVQRC